jgi:hypothetical protein
MAATCPQCAFPIHQSGLRAGRLNPSHSGRIVTTEKTGKGLKAQQLLAVCLLITSVTMLCFLASESSKGNDLDIRLAAWGLSTFISVCWLAYVSVAKWWRHG